MNRGAYTAATGMVAQQTRLDVVAHNLANVNVRGYKADRVSFEDMMRRSMADEAGYGDAVGSLASGPAAKVETTDFSQGAAEETGNPLDLMLSGKTVAMFEIQKADGTKGFTRDGSFELNDRRQLVTKANEPVLDGQGVPITLDGKPTVTSNGDVQVDGRTVATVGRFVGTFQKDENGGGLFVSDDARAATAADGVTVDSGRLETANVDPITTMVEMISLQRTYEMAQKMIQSQDESTAKLAEAMG